jgi:hypothetical protein
MVASLDASSTTITWSSACNTLHKFGSNSAKLLASSRHGITTLTGGRLVATPSVRGSNDAAGTRLARMNPTHPAHHPIAKIAELIAVGALLHSLTVRPG